MSDIITPTGPTQSGTKGWLHTCAQGTKSCLHACAQGTKSWLHTRVQGNNLLVTITIGLFIALYASGMGIYSNKNFGTLQSLLDMFTNNSAIIVLAAGMTMIIVLGGIDISVGGQLAMYCMMFAVFIQRLHVNAYVMIVIVLLTGLVFGLFQGVLVAYFKLQPFIVTLAGMFLARGLTTVVSTDTINITDRNFMALAMTRIRLPFGGLNGFGSPSYLYLHALLAIIVVVIMFFVMTRTRFGRDIYAVGGSEQSAMLMGLNTKRIKLSAYMLMGLLTACAGFCFCLMTPGSSVEKAQGYEMTAIAAAVIGGALLTGGVGSILGSLVGVLVLSTATKLINFNGTLMNGWTDIVKGAIMGFFIVLQSVFIYFRGKRK